MARPPLDGTVLVTGASSGLGAAFARRLAASASRLVLVARRRDRLEALAASLAAEYPRRGVHGDAPHPWIRVEPCDLTVVSEVHALVDRLEADGIVVDVLVNDAGIGDMCLFEHARWPKLAEMLSLNVVGLTALTLRLYPPMVARGRGGILNVSSGFGLVPSPGFAAYAGSKHYVSGFTESLRAEAAGTGVVVCHACPGPVQTEFVDRAENRLGFPVPAAVMLSPDRCARDVLAAFGRGRALVVPGWLLWFGIHLGRITPNAVLRLVFGVAARALRRRVGAVSSR